MSSEKREECGVCLAHSGMETQIAILVDSMKVIKRMFYAIIVGLVLSIMRPTIATLVDGNTSITQAHECDDCSNITEIK